MKQSIAFALFLIFLHQVQAQGTQFIGVGLTWNTEGIVIGFDKKACIIYQIYNPFDIDVNASLKASGDIIKIVRDIHPKSVYVKAHTPQDQAIPVKLCVYGVKEFPYKPKTYSGQVLATYTSQKGAGTGSLVSASVAAPLKVRVGTWDLYNRIKRGIAALFLIFIAVITISYRSYKGRLERFG